MSTKLAPVFAWLRQTSTIAGFMIAAGLVADLVTHNSVYSLAAAAAVGIVMPGHPELKADITQLSTDAAAAVAIKGSAASLMAITGDMVKLSHELAAGTQVVVVQPVPPVVAPTFRVVAPPVAPVASTLVIAPAA